MKFENCIYDHLQLADRFLNCAENLLKVREYSINSGKLLGSDFAYGVNYFGFSHPIQLVRWKVKYSRIFNDDAGKFLYLLDEGRGFILGAIISPDFAFEIAAHYIGVAERLMRLEDE